MPTKLEPLVPLDNFSMKILIPRVEQIKVQIGSSVMLVPDKRTLTLHPFERALVLLESL
jgi:hypothetical protein